MSEYNGLEDRLPISYARADLILERMSGGELEIKSALDLCRGADEILAAAIAIQAADEIERLRGLLASIREITKLDPKVTDSTTTGVQ